MKKRMKTEETKEKGEMKTSFSYPFYMNPHPLCHCFSNFWSRSFFSPTLKTESPRD